jgi:phasin
MCRACRDVVAPLPHPTGHTALNMVRFAEMSLKRESDMSDPKMTMEVPPQVRDFAVKSVDQAERAISSFMESASKSVAMVPSPMNDVAQQALAITEKNLKASFEHARKLMNAKDVNEVMQLQTEFLRNQFGVATEQTKQMSGGIASAGGDVAKEEPDLI